MPAEAVSAGVVVVRLRLRIGAVRQQQLHQLEIARLGGPDERRRARFEEPLIREDRPLQRVFLHPRVDVGALRQQELDELQVVHVRLGHRVVAALDVAVVGREVQRRPAALVGEVHVGAALDQVGAQLVVAVLRRREQRRPAVFGRLVDVGARVEQQLGRFDVAFARREDKRGQAAAAAAHEAGHDVVRGILSRILCRLRGSRATAAAPACGRRRGGITIRLSGAKPGSGASERAVHLLELNLLFDGAPGRGGRPAARTGQRHGVAVDRPDRAVPGAAPRGPTWRCARRRARGAP